MIAPLHYLFDDFEAETDLGQKIFETIAAPPTTLITGITSDQKRAKANVSVKIQCPPTDKGGHHQCADAASCGQKVIRRSMVQLDRSRQPALLLLRC